MALNHRWQTRHPSGTEGGQVQVLGSFGQEQCLGSFGDTVSHLPDCYSLYAMVPDAERSYLNCSDLSGRPFPIPTFRPAKLVTWQPVIPNVPNGRNPFYPRGK